MPRCRPELTASAELYLLRRVASTAVRLCEILIERQEATLTVTNLTEQSRRISSRVQTVLDLVRAAWPDGGPQADAIARAVYELLIEVQSAATILAAQAVLPAAAQATVAVEDVKRLTDELGDLRTLVGDHTARLDGVDGRAQMIEAAVQEIDAIVQQLRRDLDALPKERAV